MQQCVRDNSSLFQSKLLYIKYTLIYATILFFCITGSVFAQSNPRVGDCSLVSDYFVGSLDNIIANKILGFNPVYPAEDIHIAVKHLAYYCCEKNIIADTGVASVCPTKDASGNFGPGIVYAETSSLFDHLLDVGMRRLSGNGDQQYDTAGLDPLAVERREKIRDIAHNPQGAIPGSVLAVYDQYRKMSDSVLPMLHTPGNFATIKQSRNDMGLQNRYYAMCYTVREIYGTFFDNGIRPAQPNSTLFKNCLDLASRLVENEFAYTKHVMTQQGANYLHFNTMSYVDGYFVRDRMQTLLQKFAFMQTDFGVVAQKVNEGTKMCSGR